MSTFKIWCLDLKPFDTLANDLTLPRHTMGNFWTQTKKASPQQQVATKPVTVATPLSPPSPPTTPPPSARTLRAKTPLRSTEQSSATSGFSAGQLVSAKWDGGDDDAFYAAKIKHVRPATSSSGLEYDVVFYDGVEHTVSSVNVKTLSDAKARAAQRLFDGADQPSTSSGKRKSADGDANGDKNKKKKKKATKAAKNKETDATIKKQKKSAEAAKKKQQKKVTRATARK